MANDRLCPFCSERNSEEANRCGHCGHDLPPMEAPKPTRTRKKKVYEIVPDGTKFGIKYRGELIVVRGLKHEVAKFLLAALNSRKPGKGE